MHVRLDGPGDGASDCADIQCAIDAAVDGDLLLVGPGTWDLRAPLDYRGKAIAVRSEAGREATVLRRTAGESIDFSGAIAVFRSGEGVESTLEGFTLVGGWGQRACAPCLARGGALSIDGASPSIRDCIIEECEADFGGGIHIARGAPLIRNVIVRGNRASDGGGIFVSTGSAPRVDDCLVEANEALAGGGLYIFDRSDARIERTVVRANRALAHADRTSLFPHPEGGLSPRDSTSGGFGGGAFIAQDSAPEFNDCVFAQNEASSGGGLVIRARSAPVLRTTRIEGNRAFAPQNSFNGGYGGGALVESASAPVFETCDLTDNVALLGGGMAILDRSEPLVRDSVIAANAAPHAGGGVFSYLSSPVFEQATITANSGGAFSVRTRLEQEDSGIVESLPVRIESSIVWGNMPAATPDTLRAWDVSARFSCLEWIPDPCCNEGIVPADDPALGNLFTDPLFCGWEGPQAWVDPAAPEEGDGGAVRPYRALERALGAGWSAAPAPGSPCLGMAEDGGDMGAARGGCDARGAERRTFHLRAGRHELGGRTLSRGASLAGVGSEISVVIGTVHGLGSGASLADLTVTAGRAGGIVLPVSAEPAIERMRVVANQGDGIVIPWSARPDVRDTVIARNSGSGIRIHCGGRARIEHATIAGNADPLGAGVSVSCGSDEHTVALRSSIVWGNAGGGVIGTTSVEHSCVQGAAPLPGHGNRNDDPRFCGWNAVEAVLEVVDASELARALDPAGYSLALSPDSPCLGAAPDGSDIGAPTGRCEGPAMPGRSIRLAAGTYDLRGLAVQHPTSLSGAGVDATVLVGTVHWIHDGQVLEDLTVRDGGRAGAVILASGGEPVVRRVRIDGSAGAGITGGAAAAIEDVDVTGCAGAGIWLGSVFASVPARADAGARISGARVRGNGLLGIAVELEPEARVDIARSDVSGNHGSGVDVYGGAEARIEQVTVAGNHGPGLNVYRTRDAEIESCVVRGNGEGVRVHGAAVRIARCTVTGSGLGGGLQLREGSRGAVESSVFWGNAGGAIIEDAGASSVTVTGSVIEGGHAGASNIDRDPLFTGWGGRSAIHVDPARAMALDGTADGSQARPYASTADAIASYDLALAPQSPCLASDGTVAIGADTGVSDGPRSAETSIRLAVGSHDAGLVNLAWRASLIGVSRAQCRVDGHIIGLRTGTMLASAEIITSPPDRVGIQISEAEAPEIRDLGIQGGSAGIYCLPGSTPTISNCHISRTHNDGISIWDSSPRVSDCVLLENNYGVAAFGADSAPHFAGCDIRRNREAGVSCSAGAEPVFERTRVRENKFGVDIASASPLLVNCEVTENANVGVGVGRTGDLPEPRPVLRHVTIAGNGWQWGGQGVYLGSSRSITIESSIIWGNTGGSFVSDTAWPADIRHSTIAGDTVPPGPGNSNADPLFQGAGDTPYALRPGSPAIDTADPALGVGEDIDGRPRPCGDGPDRGAYEACGDALLPIFRRGDADASGRVDISDGIRILGFLFLGGGEPACADAADVNDDGRLEMADAIGIFGFLYLGGAAPAAPGPADCGLDAGGDPLECARSAPCP